MTNNDKVLLYRTVRTYLEEQSPEQLDEFDVVFDDVYDVIVHRVQEKDQQNGGDSYQGGGLAFDAGAIVGTLITTACWIGFTLLRAAVKYGVKERIRAALDRAQKGMEEAGVKHEKVQKLRQILEGILGEA